MKTLTQQSFGDFYRVDGTAIMFIYSERDELAPALLEKLGEFEKKYGDDRTNFGIMNVKDADNQFLTDYDLLDTPVLVMYRAGNPVGRVTKPASVESAIEEIEYLLQIFAGAPDVVPR